ncbi:MAG: hypothetical protein AAGA54_05215 [Myxococcota bacterium]
MIDPELARARYDFLRECDRTIASMQSKQRMRPVFGHLLDEEAKETLDAALQARLRALRTEAAALARALARRALLELGVDDLGRIGPGLQRLDAYLAAEPAESLDVCFDLLTFLEQREEVFDLFESPPPPIDPGS